MVKERVKQHSRIISRGGIIAPQWRHLPLERRYEKTGICSRNFRGWPQLPHRQVESVTERPEREERRIISVVEYAPMIIKPMIRNKIVIMRVF